MEENMSIVIAGGAGFIGYHLTKRLLTDNIVLNLDNLCRGQRAFLEDLPDKERLCFEEVDLADEASTFYILKNWHHKYPIDIIWHLAANSDIPAGILDGHVDLHNTFMTTFSLLECMKKLSIPRIAFASSSAIYGDHGLGVKLDEDSGPFFPISNYGAMKLASEAAISAALESFLEQAWIFRFPNVVGSPATHGVIVDFIRKLKQTPEVLQVLGNGSQQKVYLHVSELISAMLFIKENSTAKLNYFNIGPADQGISVKYIAEETRDRVSPRAAINYGREGRGWVGDVPRFFYDTRKLTRLGFTASLSSLEAVRRAIDEIAIQEGC